MTQQLSPDLVRSIGALNQVWPDRVSVTSRTGCKLTSTQRQAWTRLIRQTYPTDALKAGYAMFGRALALTDLDHISPRAADWLHCTNRYGGVAPLLAPAVRVGAQVPADIHGLRRDILARGLKPVAWRWLQHQRNSVTGRLFALGVTPEAIWWANILSSAQPHPVSTLWLESGRPYLAANLYAQAQSCVSPEERQLFERRVEAFFRLVPAKADTQTLAQYELMIPAFIMGGRRPEHQLNVLKGRTWSSLLREIQAKNQARLHATQGQFSDPHQSESNVTWEPCFGDSVAEGVVVREIVSEQQLKFEGALMAHCVGNGTYTTGCRLGEHAILSLEEPVTGARATLQLTQNGSKKWGITQLAGVGNMAVPDIFWRAARKLCGVETSSTLSMNRTARLYA